MVFVFFVVPQGSEEHVRARGVIVEVVGEPDCVRLMDVVILSKLEFWNEDIWEQVVE